MVKNINVKNVAVGIIKDYMGDSTARQYFDFYQNQNNEAVVDSVSEILKDYVGGLRSEEILIKKGLIKKTNP